MSIKTEHLSVAGIQFEQNKKVGYYTVNNEIFYNKMQALLAASKQKDLPKNYNNDAVRWFFNEETFIKFPWHIEPETSLTELYRMRAQQLRDQYDYIRIEASGGGDSTTAVFSFLLNGIHLDEVVFRYPKLGEKNVCGNPWDTTPENTLSEWEFAAKPLLQWISVNYPSVKITVHDYSTEMVNSEDALDESWIFKTRQYLQPGHAHKHTNVGLIDHKLEADRGKKIAVVYGVDKPRLCVKDGKWFLYFVDIMANHNHADTEGYDNITTEFFYWTPDFPEILAKQSHMVVNWFSMPQNHKFQHVVNYPNNNFAARTLYEQLAKSIIYPDYDSHTFQTAKPTNNIFNEMDTWFHVNFKNTSLYNTWESGINYLLDNLHDTYKSQDMFGVVKDIKTYSTPLYYIGDSVIPNNAAFKTKEIVENFRNDQSTQIHCVKGQLSVY